MNIQNLTIQPHPPYCNCDFVKIDSVSESIQEKLAKFEKLNHVKAIEILRKVKWEADISSLLCQPKVHLPILAVLSIASWKMMFKMNHIILFILGFVFFKVSVGALGFCLGNMSKFINTSSAYNEKSKEAAKYLDILEKSSQEMEINFPIR